MHRFFWQVSVVQINFFKIENAGDFILIFVICLNAVQRETFFVSLYALFCQHVPLWEKKPFQCSVFILKAWCIFCSLHCLEPCLDVLFYCRNTYLYWEYLIPLITVILSHRALLTSDLEKTTPPPPGCGLGAKKPQHVEEQKSGGRGEEGLFSGAFQLHWAWLHCPSFPNEGCTQQGPSPPAVACKQDHCSLGKMSCGNGQYLWHELPWGLHVPTMFSVLL